MSPDGTATAEAAGAASIFGRNMWQRQFDEALAMTEQIKDLLRLFPA